MRKSIFFLGVLALTVSALFAQEPRPLYPAGAKNSNGLKPENVRDDKENRVLVSASDADYFVFLPDKDKATGQAVIICPGGAYLGTAYGHEGLDVARWMNERGVAAFVLRYRMPNGHPDVPLSDVHEMFRIVRRNAAEWGINPHNVGIMGFSAGGHLASTAATHFDAETRPDFAILIYPVVTFGERFTHMTSREQLIGPGYDAALVKNFSNELQVTPQTPRTFLALSDDDTGVPPRNSTGFYDALRANGVPGELHIYPTGGHGWGWRDSFPYHNELRTSLDRWLKGE